MNTPSGIKVEVRSEGKLRTTVEDSGEVPDSSTAYRYEEKE